MMALMEFLEVFTVGLPFCAFKIICGLVFLQQGWTFLAYPVIAIGIVDTVINSSNLLSIAFRKKRVMSACLFSMKSEMGSKQEDFTNSIDTLFSFILVAYMVGMEKIGGLPFPQLPLWNWSVVLNVLGAGIFRFTHSYRNLPKK